MQSVQHPRCRQGTRADSQRAGFSTQFFPFLGRELKRDYLAYALIHIQLDDFVALVPGFAFL